MSLAAERSIAPDRSDRSYAAVTDRIGDIALARRPRPGWLLATAVAAALTLLFLFAIGWLFANGVGIWGVNIPVVWGFAITNYVWWIGMGMAGTFISAALLLLRQPWRSAINRAAESMTVFAVAIAGLFPILHLGRPWFFYWLAPYPDIMNVWPQWRSALVWDFFAILAYLAVSLLFWYVGLLPDLASLRDRAESRRQRLFYGFLALGWRGEARHWRRHETLMLLLSGLAVPLVFSVHSMVALDFSEGIVPGWHTTIYPPFFVAGALFSGFALVLVLLIPLRRIYRLDDFITPTHLDKLAKLLLAVGLIVAYSYLMDAFSSLYSGDPHELRLLQTRLDGPYASVYWATLICNVLIPQALWLRAARANRYVLLGVGVSVVVGMWLERYMLVVSSLYRGYLPSESGLFHPTLWDWLLLAGSIGLFALLFLLFVRLLPLLPLFELRRLAADAEGDRA